tara:strand:- start:2977 stop:3558 length:582 start_codon:yes stop_codon:yes gene_type:complete
MKLVKKTEAGGFSLVEVTIAMAIAAVAVVSILGLLPQGLDTMRAAGDEAIQARIHQQILNEIQMTPFNAKETNSAVEAFNKLEIYYDGQGEELGNSKGSSSVKGSFDHIYTARVTLPKAGSDSAPDSVGGAKFDGVTFSKGGSEVNKYIRPVVIEIAPVGGLADKFDWSDEANRSTISTYQTYIVQMGHDFTP